MSSAGRRSLAKASRRSASRARCRCSDVKWASLFCGGGRVLVLVVFLKEPGSSLGEGSGVISYCLGGGFGRLEGVDDVKAGVTYHGRRGYSSNSLIYLSCRLNMRWQGQIEGRVVLFRTVRLLLLLLSLLLLLLGAAPTSDPCGHRQLGEGSGVRVDSECK